MPRPRRCATVTRLPAATCYKPQGIPLRGLDTLTLSVEALEAMRLVDGEGMSHDEAAGLMQISRPTLTRILGQGRQNVARALSGGLAIRIVGGAYRVAESDNAPTHGFPGGAVRAPRVVAVSAQGPAPGDQVDPRFGRAKGFVVVTLETMAHRYLDNAAALYSGHRAGINAAGRLAAMGVDTVLTGLVGPRAMAALAAAGIAVIQGLDPMTVAGALDALRRGELPLPASCNPSKETQDG